MSYAFLIYLGSVAHSLSNVFGFVGVISLTALFPLLLWWSTPCYDQQARHKAATKIAIRLVTCCVVSFFIGSFIPDKEVFRQIVAVKFVSENQQAIKELPADVKDYVISFLKEAKDALK